MPYQEDFAVEQFMDKYEVGIQYNLGETCCYSLSLGEIAAATGNEFQINPEMRLTYGAIKGSDTLRTKIASLYGDQFTKENVLITNGAIGANFLVYYTLVGKNDHVICIDPTYSQLYSVPRMFGAEVDQLRLETANNFLPDMKKIRSLIRKNTKLIIINTPNNPLGRIIPRDLMIELVEICKEFDIYLHCDEVYRPLFHSSNGSMISDPGCALYSKAVTTGSMSKAYALAGIRLGWIITKDLNILRDAASRRDYNTISVSMLDDAVAEYALENVNFIMDRNYKLCIENLNILTNFLNENSDYFEFYAKPEAGTVCLVTIKNVKDTMQFGRFIAEKYRILAVPGECFGIAGTLRIGYGNSKNDLLNGLPLLKEAYMDFISLKD